MDRAVIFSEGCNARLAGLPIDANPYKCKSKDPAFSEWGYWRAGWSDVNRFWGVRCSGYVLKPLVPVMKGKTL